MIDSSIIKIASDISNYGLKRETKYIASSKNRICGDKITVELEISKNKILKMNYETESCIFCQASASILAKIVANYEIKSLKEKIKKVIMNKEFDNIVKIKKFKNFKKLNKKEYKNRFNCLMLPFHAILKALT